MYAPSLAGRVLRLLLESTGPRSGQEMAGKLGVSRAAVGKAVTSLREQGLRVEARPRLGYQLQEEPPDPLPVRLEARLRPGSLGLPLYHYAELDSTNLEARRQAEAGAVHGACFVAESQTAGRGRLGRAWLAPPGSSLLFSLLLRPGWPLKRVFLLNNVISLAVCRAVENLTGLCPLVKWPNDVFLRGGKLAGVLTEFMGRSEMAEHVVVGVGLNVNQDEDYLASLESPAASLFSATGQLWDRGLVLAAVLAQATTLWLQLAEGREDRVLAEYQERSMILGREITVKDGDELRKGRVEGFTPEGNMLLVTERGTLTISHGDVTLAKHDLEKII
ncbi:MAG: biotin--[acetyl-CoA-carboxylase] ligase [Deltaproteobacteria bacterium]|nr:biotin--[acetyl-CoA-carboxylase] ligase [Deltaproteobacteria bacterium]